MTALWFAHLGRSDRVAVKPHASPVFHAIQYLLGDLDRSLPDEAARPRWAAVLPEPDQGPGPGRLLHRVGGPGRRAPLFAAVTRRYVDAHFGPRDRSRFVALMGDAELDEGNVWEAVADPAAAGLGNVMWIVDFNRQSLDRVVPAAGSGSREAQFAAAGWHVSSSSTAASCARSIAQPHGEALQRWMDEMPTSSTRPCSTWLASICAGGSGTAPRQRSPRRSTWRSPTYPTPSSPRSFRTSAATTSPRCWRPMRSATQSSTDRR